MHNRIILCCCLLHNLIREHSVLDPLVNQVYEDTQPVDCETVGTIETSNAWTAFRDGLAVDMFNDLRGRRGHSGSSNTVTTGSRHFHWTPVLDEMLVQSVMELFEARQFQKKESNKKLQQKMAEKCPGCGIKANPHIQSRLKTMKVNWSAVYELANASGFGWDPVLKPTQKPQLGATRRSPIRTSQRRFGPRIEQQAKEWRTLMIWTRGFMKMRKRACVDRDDKYVEALKMMSRMMDTTELHKLVGFTPLELCHAHEKLKASKMLWSLFNEATVENKANFIRGIIAGME
ncbi:protein ALP1-like [Senna tora]|uniref:Protein ALP1-like n=1 Tax=Senna tora TaxID=362788 RepID=A0A834W851_9FABA|nr:protein ALP1-like [Senna tora]